MKYSIRQTLLVGSTLGTLFILIVAGVFGDQLVNRLLLSDFDKVLLAKAQVLQTLTKEGYVENGSIAVELDFADEFMSEFDRKVDPEYFQIWFINGETLEKSNMLGDTNLAQPDIEFSKLKVKEPPSSFQATSNATPIYGNAILPDGREGRYVSILFTPQIPDDALRTKARLAAQKNMVLTVSKERESLNNLILQVRITMFSLMSFVLVFLILLLRFIIRLSLESLNEIENQIHGMDGRDLSKRLFIQNPPPELISVQSQFNVLMQKLETAFIREKQFSADVAHELRTPISELMNSAEVALRWPEEKQLTARCLNDALDISNQMKRLVDDLFSLAHSDNNRVKIELTLVSLNDILTTICNKLQQINPVRNYKVTFTGIKNAHIYTDAAYLGLILINIIDNAIDHGDAPNEITIDITESNRTIIISVCNHAQKLSHQNLEQMFDRFWQLDASRSAVNHTGLGLSLVKAYVSLLELEVDVHLSDASLLTVSLNGLHLDK